MLYSMYDWQFAAAQPWRLFAVAGQELFSNPAMPVSDTRFGRAMAAGFELFERTTRRYVKPSFGIDQTWVDGRTVAVKEEVALAADFGNLIRFARDTDREDPKILLVAPMSGHYATLLRGTVAAMLPDHDVYVTDWTDARDIPAVKGRFDLDDYIDYLVTFLEHLGPDTHVVAVCQPSVPVMAAVSLMAEDDHPCQPASMTLMGGPIDTRINPTAVNRYAEERPIEWFRSSVLSSVPMAYPGAGRTVYPGFMQLSGFMTMNMDRHYGAHVKLFEHLVTGDGDSAEAHRRFYDEYLSVMDMTAEFYLKTVETVFQRHDLPKGQMMSRDRKVDPAAIRKTALLTIEGELDDISATGQTEAAHPLCKNLLKSKRKHHLQKQVGHYGIFNGRRWREQIYPVVRDFIRTHS
jgi:poly(3-hydroxybutyrate) depolymerase